MVKFIITTGITAVFMIVFAAAHADCESECQPDQSCNTLLECKMAEVDCRQSCRQREVLEDLAAALEEISVSIQNSSVNKLNESELLTQPVPVPASEAIKERKTPFMQIDRGAVIIEKK